MYQLIAKIYSTGIAGVTDDLQNPLRAITGFEEEGGRKCIGSLRCGGLLQMRACKVVGDVRGFYGIPASNWHRQIPAARFITGERRPECEVIGQGVRIPLIQPILKSLFVMCIGIR